jgi:peptide/nickel transport system substrate-binding protein
MALATRTRRAPGGAARRRIALVTCTALLAVAFGGCASDGDPDVSAPATVVADLTALAPPDEDSPVEGGTLRVAWPTGVADWNPVTADWTTSEQILAAAVYEPLLRVSETRGLEPWLAESVTSDPELQRWTIRVRADVSFHDGSGLSAAAVAANLQARLDTAPWAAVLHPVDEIVVVDPMTVEVVLDQPWARFDWLLATPVGWQAAPDTLEVADGALLPAASTAPVGTGPFRTSGPIAPDGSLTLRRNEDHWLGVPPLERVEVAVAADAEQRTDLLVGGDVDLTVAGDPESVLRLWGREGIRQVEDLTGTESIVELNTEAAPFDDPDVRRAAGLATDRSLLQAQLGGGVLDVASGPWTATELGGDEPAPPVVDTSRAEVVLAGRTPQISLRTQPTAEDVQLATAVAGQWEDAGFEVDVVITPAAELARRRTTGDYQALVTHDYGQADPDVLSPRWQSAAAAPAGEAAWNPTRVTDDDVDGTLAELRAAADPGVRATANAAALDAIHQTSSTLWLLHDVWAVLAIDRVGGLPTIERLGFARRDATFPWHALWLRA